MHKYFLFSALFLWRERVSYGGIFFFFFFVANEDPLVFNPVFALDLIRLLPATVTERES